MWRRGVGRWRRALLSALRTDERTVRDDDVDCSRIQRIEYLNIHGRRISATVNPVIERDQLCKNPGKAVKSFRRQR